jgi:hypothetical protein
MARNDHVPITQGVGPEITPQVEKNARDRTPDRDIRQHQFAGISDRT